MMKKSWLAVFIVSLAVIPSLASAQEDIGEQLKKMAGDYARGYVSPLIQGWTAGLNSGLYHSADLHDVLGFDVQLKITGSLLGDADKKFKIQMPATITYNPGAGPITLQRGTDYPAEVEVALLSGKRPKQEFMRHLLPYRETRKSYDCPPVSTCRLPRC